MTTTIVRGACIAGALAVLALAPTIAAAATPITFSLTGLPVQSSGGFKYVTQTVGGVKMRATAWSLSNQSGTGTVAKSTIGVYSQGLGATSSGENGNGNTHTLDNQGQRDFIVFTFDRKVDLYSALFTAFNLSGSVDDTDFTVGYANVGGAWNANPAINALSLAQLSTYFGGTLSNYAGNTLSNHAATQLLSPGTQYANTWLVGASFANPDRNFDSFKLRTLKLQTAPVPESATWMMMIAGFGAAGVAMRRKTATRLATA